MPAMRGRGDPNDTGRGQSPAVQYSAYQIDTPRSNADTPGSYHHSPASAGVREDELRYQSGISGNDKCRPSLPSLRAVLGENVRTPPATPQHQKTALPLEMREPLYDQSSLKPSALYPNKRTRTDSGWDGEHADGKEIERASITLPFINGPSHNRDGQRQLELPTLNGGNPAVYHYRRSGDLASPKARGRSTQLSVSPPAAQAQAFDIPSRSYTHFHHVARNEPPGDRGYSSHATHSRSPSIAVAGDGNPMYNHPASLQQSFPADHNRASLLPTSHNNVHREDYHFQPRLDTPVNYNAAAYPYSQAFFVPSHYDYQNGKSRKRSNLPKQSTEIMKRWFDDNLQNPYPSEEQKRHFAAVAGINLTQVSNWFINHRRRCPELREKRDKGRAGSREESV
ncbi:hypothetical protein AAFC00_001707 [Neodothiora populina]